jgi:hypothetical protein
MFTVAHEIQHLMNLFPNENTTIYLFEATDNVLTDPGTPLSQERRFELLFNIRFTILEREYQKLTDSIHRDEVEILSTSQRFPSSSSIS